MTSSDKNDSSSAAVPPGDSLELKLPDESSAPKDLALWAGMLALLALIAFWPATDGKFLWNDNWEVSENHLLAQPGGMFTAWVGRWQDPAHYLLPQYHPMAFSSNWVSYRLFGHDDQGMPVPFAYHLGNLLLHAGAAVMLWFLLRKLKLPGAWLMAAVFALHPLNAEAVSWISQRDTIMAGLLFFAAFYTYLMFVDEDDAALSGMVTDPGKRWGLYAAALVLFLLAMLSKSTAFAFPFIVLLVLWWQGKFKLRHVGLLLPFAIIAVGLAWSAADFERDFGGATTPDLSFAQRLIIAGSAIWFYVGKLLVPIRLTLLYPQWVIDPQHVSQFVPLLLVILVLAGLWAARKQIGRGPLVAALAFIACLFPLLGFFNIYPMRYSYVADHYAYLATAPLIVLVIAACSRAVQLLQSNKSHVPTAVGLSTILLVALGATTWNRTPVFADSQSLWQDTVEKNPGSWFAHSRLAAILLSQSLDDLHAGDVDSLHQAGTELNEGLDHSQKAAQLNPTDASIEFTWGRVLMEQNQLQLAERRLPASTQPDWVPIPIPPQPLEQAIEHLAIATRLDPSLPAASDELAKALLIQKSYDRAIAVLDEAMAHQPPSSLAHELLAVAFTNKGDTVRAMNEDAQAIALQPGNVMARQHYADLLAKAGKLKAAVLQLTFIAMQEQRTNTNEPRIWNTLGTLENRMGQIQVAIEFFQQALKLDPNFAEARKNLDQAVEKEKQEAATRPATTQAATPNTTP